MMACSEDLQAASPASVSPNALSAREFHAATKPVGLVLNGLAEDRPTLAGEIGGRIVVLRDDLRRLGLLLPPTERGLFIEGQWFVPLSDIPGLTGRLDEEEAMLLLSARPDAFVAARHASTAQAPSVPASTIIPLAFLGYDLSLSRDAGRWRAGVFLDAGASGRWGVAGTTAIVQPGSRRLIRLESNLQRDFPDRRLRLIVGDTVSRTGEFTGQVRYGGLRIGTDFALAPDEITYPLPIVAGSALVPSTVELLAASSRQSHSVAPGNFLIEAPATISGAGEIVMTVRDALGTARQVRQAFYSSSSLLRPGLTDFSFELGALRKHYADRSAAYGDAFVAASWRHGLTSVLTTGMRVEASRSATMAGLALQAIIGRVGEVALAGAMSRSAIGPGSMLKARVQRIGRKTSLQASYLSSSNAFAQLGQDRFQSRHQGRRELSASASFALPTGEIGIGMIDARLRDGSRYALRNLNYSATLKGFYLQASLRSARFAQGTDRGFFLALSRPIGSRGSMALTADKGSLTSSYQRSAAAGNGMSFGMASTRGGGDHSLNGYAIANTSLGDFELTASRARREFSLRGSARGALVYVGDRLMPTARIHDGLALVAVASRQGVGILQEGRPVTRKARSGRPVLLTGLQPHGANRIAIRTEDLPLDVDILEDEVMAVPGFRQAALVSFGSPEPATPATIALVDDHGNALPAGLEVWAGGVRIGVTGYDGLVFVGAAGTGRTITVMQAQGPCTAILPAGSNSAGDGASEPIRCRQNSISETAK